MTTLNPTIKLKPKTRMRRTAAGLFVPESAKIAFDFRELLDPPCKWCGLEETDDASYWDVQTHKPYCPWHDVDGVGARAAVLPLRRIWTREDFKKVRRGLSFLHDEKIEVVFVCKRCKGLVTLPDDGGGEFTLTCSCTARRVVL